MIISTITTEDTKVVIKLNGRIDTNSSPELDTKVSEVGEGLTAMELDFADVEYISSAGLRVILKAHRMMTGNGGTLTLTHVNEDIMQIFDITGFTDFLTIE